MAKFFIYSIVTLTCCAAASFAAQYNKYAPVAYTKQVIASANPASLNSRSGLSYAAPSTKSVPATSFAVPSTTYAVPSSYSAPLSYAPVSYAPVSYKLAYPAYTTYQKPVVAANQAANAYKRNYNRGHDTLTKATGDLNTQGQRLEYGYAELEGYGLKDHSAKNKHVYADPYDYY